MATVLQNENQALRERLRVLSNHHNQSELARRTGFSKANVHRYMKSGRVPGAWLIALIREFGVNPAWLMLGRGEMLQSEVSAQAAQESANLLELVVKLNAVGHERLGALQSRQRTKMVRELADTLNRHDDLRGRLRERVNPVYLKLLNEYRELIAQQRFEETQDILPALRQLERLADNPRMRNNIDMLEAVQRQFEGNFQRQQELYRSSLGNMIAAGRVRDAQFLRLAFNACAGLSSAGRYREAARLANATMLLAECDPPRWDEDWLLRLPQAALDLHTGEPARGLAEIARVVAACSDELAAGARDALLHAGYLAGTTTLSEVIERSSAIPATTHTLLLIGLWEGDRAVLKGLQASRRKLKGQFDARSARLLRLTDALLSGSLPPEPPEADYEEAVLRCEVARNSGNRRTALRYFRAAAKASAVLDPAFTSEFLLRALHLRQTFEYGDRSEAARWLVLHLRQGYGCLRELAARHAIRTTEPGNVLR
jgi:hypothetical protein